ncbi:MAG: hypothetical protein HY289_03120 [Planctomycetes bacterium]|nr:hypothetical protein [Planctomycetota bacterium]
MTQITVQLTPEAEQRLRQRANERGESLEAFLGELAEKAANGDGTASDLLGQGLEWLTQRSADDVQAARRRILGEASAVREIPAGKTILDMVEGKWPGSETDAEIQDALKRMS